MPETASIWLGFDFGLQRIGVAHGNSVMKQAHPLCVIAEPTNDGKFAAIATLLQEWQANACVVGLPLHPDGAEHDMTRRCRRFANQLHGRFGLAISLVDERYSSAVLNAKRGEVIDAAAAAIILQQYFDQQGTMSLNLSNN
jgi:putative holliday junction resolvase